MGFLSFAYGYIESLTTGGELLGELAWLLSSHRWDPEKDPRVERNLDPPDVERKGGLVGPKP